MRKLFMYRFHEGMLSGHNFGNILLSALEKVTGDPLSAIDAAHKILDVNGEVIPVSSVGANLFAELSDGTVLEGESVVDKRDQRRAPIVRCFLSPQVEANPRALQSIKDTDLLVLGPGDLFSSLIPVLLVDGVKEAIASRQGSTVLVLNLVTRPGQVSSRSASDFVRVVSRYLEPGSLSDVIVNSGKPDPDLLAGYSNAGDLFLEDDFNGMDFLKIHRVDCLAQKHAESVPGDVLKRSLIRHDPEKLANAIIKIFYAE